MISNKSLLTISLVYLSILIPNYYLFDIHNLYIYTISTLMVTIFGYNFISLPVRASSSETNPRWLLYLDANIVKYIAHSLFIQMLAHIFFSIIIFIINITYHLGFTMIILYVIYLLFNTYDPIMVSIITNNMEYYYNILPSSIGINIIKYLELYAPIIYNNLYLTHVELIDNVHSKIIIEKLNNQKNNLSSYITKKLSNNIQEINYDLLEITEEEYQALATSNTFKSNYRFPNLNIDMDSKNEIFDDLDDDVDVDDEPSIVPVIETNNNDKRALLRKKIADKKAGRLPGSNPRMNMSVNGVNPMEMMNTPEMKGAMEMMMQGGNLKNMMEQMNGVTMTNEDEEQMKMIMASMMRK